VTLSPLLSLWGLLSPPGGSCSCSSLTPAHEARFSPLIPHFLCTSLRFCMVGISLSSFTVGAELSPTFAKYLSVTATWCCWGALGFLTSASRPRFAFGNASAAVTLVGPLKCLDCLPLPIILLSPSLSSSCCSVTATYFPLSPPPQLTPYCAPFRCHPSVAEQKPTSVTPVLLAVANAALTHLLATPHHIRLHLPFHPTIRHHFVPQYRSSVQVHTRTS